MTYKQAVNWADDIRDYTRDRKMPPWKPVGGPEQVQKHPPHARCGRGGNHEMGGHRLPGRRPERRPAPRPFSTEWHLGKPDLVLEVPEDFHVGPSGLDLFRCFVFPTELGEDKYIVGYEVLPGNPRVVHHTLNFFNTTGQGRDMLAKEKAAKLPPDAVDFGPGYASQMGIGFVPDSTKAKPGVPPNGGFGGWAPGQHGTRTPQGTRFQLAK